MNFFLQIAKEDYTTPIIEKGVMETLMFGGQMLLLGISTVFAVLALIWLCLVVFKFAFQGASDKPKAKKEAAPTPAPVVAPAPVASCDDEIVAVIAAAIAMAEAESSGLKFKVVSFKRK